MNLLESSNPRRFFHGVLDAEFKNGEWRLHRLTAEQYAQVAERTTAWALRARCNSGQKIVFRTNSPFVELDLRVAGRVRPWFGLDIEVDGRMQRVLRIPRTPAEFVERVLQFPDSPEKMREIHLYLPQNLEVHLRRITLADGAAVAAVPPPEPPLLALGDSITQGMDVLSPSNVYPVQLARLLGANLLNQGIGGHVFDPDFPLPGAQTWAKPGKARPWITVSWGVNDWNSGVDEATIRKRVERCIINLELAFGDLRPHVALITPIWCARANQPNAGGTLDEFSKLIFETASAVADRAGFPIRVIDGMRLLPHSPEYLTDGVHPNDAGALLYAIRLYRELAGPMLPS